MARVSPDIFHLRVLLEPPPLHRRSRSSRSCTGPAPGATTRGSTTSTVMAPPFGGGECDSLGMCVSEFCASLFGSLGRS